MIPWLMQWEWTPDSVVALAALCLSVASWIRVLVMSMRRVHAFVKAYTVWPHYGGADSTLLVHMDLSNASVLPIGVGGIAVRMGGEWHYAERQPVRHVMVDTPLGDTPSAVQHVRVSKLPLNLDPYSTTPMYFAVSGETRFMPPQNPKMPVRCRTVRGYTRGTLTFDDARYIAPDIFFALHGIIIEPSTGP